MTDPFNARLTRANITELATQLLTYLVETMKEAKVDLVRNGPEDLPTKVLYVPVGNPVVNLITPLAFDIRDGEIQLGQIDPQWTLQATLSTARDQLGPPLLVGHCAEGLSRIYADTPEGHAQADRLRRGDLRQAFEQGDPTIIEALMVAIMHLTPQGHVRYMMATTLFRYEDGSIVFDETQMGDDITATITKSLGGMYDIMRNAFAQGSN